MDIHGCIIIPIDYSSNTCEKFSPSPLSCLGTRLNCQSPTIKKSQVYGKLKLAMEYSSGRSLSLSLSLSLFCFSSLVESLMCSINSTKHSKLERERKRAHFIAQLLRERERERGREQLNSHDG
jgi:hypothetical protein